MAADPQTVATRWAQNLGAATQKITDGVNSVTVPPGQAAARQQAAWLQNVQASANKWAARTAAVPLSSWQQAMTTKGIPRIGAGASASEAKFATFMGKLLPYIASQRATLPPRGNLQQNIARMTAFVTAMSKFSGGGGQ